MKNAFLYVCAIACTLGLMTSCNHEVTPDSVSGAYYGTMDVTIPSLGIDDMELPYQVTITKVNESYVDIALNLDLAQYINPDLSALLNYGNVVARCLVGPTIDGEASLRGDVAIANQKFPVYGEYDERAIDVIFALGLVTVEFEGIRR